MPQTDFDHERGTRNHMVGTHGDANRPLGSLFRFKGMVFFAVGMGLLALGSLTFLFTVGNTNLSRVAAIFFGLTITLSVLVGVNFLVVGTFRMVVHLYARVSQMDPRTDRRLKGQPVFWAGHLSAMAFGVMGIVIAVAREWGTMRDFFFVVLVLAFLIGFLVSVMILLIGFAAILYDFFTRVQELRQNPRFDPRRKFAEVSVGAEEAAPMAQMVQMSEAAAIRLMSNPPANGVN